MTGEKNVLKMLRLRRFWPTLACTIPSKDGSVNGLYMPAPHDHDVWAKAKAERVEKFKRRKQDKEDGKARESGPAKKHNADDKLKLALNDKLTQALVTQHHLSQNKAEELFNKVFQEAEAAQEN